MAWFVATAAVLFVASLVPFLKGESTEGCGGSVMSANAELWNRFFTMLGLVKLVLTEYITAAPFINVKMSAMVVSRVGPRVVYNHFLQPSEILYCPYTSTS